MGKACMVENHSLRRPGGKIFPTWIFSNLPPRPRDSKISPRLRKRAEAIRRSRPIFGTRTCSSRSAIQGEALTATRTYCSSQTSFTLSPLPWPASGQTRGPLEPRQRMNPVCFREDGKEIEIPWAGLPGHPPVLSSVQVIYKTCCRKVKQNKGGRMGSRFDSRAIGLSSPLPLRMERLPRDPRGIGEQGEISRPVREIFPAHLLLNG